MPDPIRKEARKEKRRLRKIGAPELKLPDAPFYIDREGKSYTREQYMNEFGASVYKEKALDKEMSKKRRKTKVKHKK